MNMPRRRGLILVAQLLLLATFLAIWQWAPSWDALRHQFTFLDPFFISSPRLVANKLVDLTTGRHDFPEIWPYFTETMKATLIGTSAGIAIGGLGGLILSQADLAYRILAPFITVINATPRIALIPIVIIIVGPGTTASAVTAITIVAFIIFFNALQGGRQIPAATTQNVRILGARSVQVMLHVRLPYVLAWTFAALPNAIAFGIVSVVTAEILSGGVGLGGLLSQAINTADATLTFAIVAVLATVGAALVITAAAVQARVLHWLPGGAEANA